MSARTSLTMVDGRMIDLLNPRVEDVDFAVIAEHLAKINRYVGATRGIVYSVAEHVVRAADAVLAETGDRRLAAYLLHHDDHEFALGDDATPKKNAIAQIAQDRFGVLAESILDAFAQLTEQIDIVIHQSAGLQWPPSPDEIAAIKRWDRILLATEWRDLKRDEPPYEFGAEPLPGIITPVSHWQDAANLYLDRCYGLMNGARS